MGTADSDLRDRLAYVTGKGGHTPAVRFGTKTAVASTATCAYGAPTGSLAPPNCGSARTGPLITSGLVPIVAERAAAAGLPRLHPHQFRHTFVHQYLADGGQEGDPQRLAGWRSPLMLRSYGASLVVSEPARPTAVRRTACERRRGRDPVGGRKRVCRVSDEIGVLPSTGT